MDKQYLDNLASFFAGTEQPVQLGFSGGLDSQVLLHMLVQLRQQKRIVGVEALHVDHGIHPDSPLWAEQCQQICRDLDVKLQIIKLKLESDGDNLEERARDARYQAFAHYLNQGQWLATAHHAQDQAETLLFRLLRGTGIRGARGMVAKRSFAPGFLVRPLLSLQKKELEALAAHYQLVPIDDPSNLDAKISRNFLRHEIFPTLNQRWAASENLAAFCDLAGEASELLNEVAESDLTDCDFAQDSGSLDKTAFLNLNVYHRKNLLNYLGLRLHFYPNQKTIHEVMRQLTQSDSSSICLNFGSGVIRQYRGRIYCSQADNPADTQLPVVWQDLASALTLEGMGRLWTENAVGGLRPPGQGETVRIAFRQGGERCRPVGRHKSNKLKIIFQEMAVPPWLRQRWPLVFYNDELVAAAGLFESAEHQTEAGEKAITFHWQR